MLKNSFGADSTEHILHVFLKGKNPISFARLSNCKERENAKHLQNFLILIRLLSSFAAKTSIEFVDKCRFHDNNVSTWKYQFIILMSFFSNKIRSESDVKLSSV